MQLPKVAASFMQVCNVREDCGALDDRNVD